jgi:hypothetical protein
MMDNRSSASCGCGDLNNLNKKLQGKDKLITDTHRVKLRLWENQLKLHNFVNFPRLKSLDTLFPERIQGYSQSILLLREKFDERFQDFKIMESECLVFVLPLKADVENAPENLQMELNNLQCDTNLKKKFSETDFYSYLPTEKFPVLGSFG